MQFLIGTSGYSYPKWKGTFYPEKLPTKKMLEFYAQHFRTVELNNTFYKLPTAAAFEGWLKEVPAEFQFAVKAPQKITHFRRLKECEEAVEALFEAVAPLAKKQLGPVLYQLPPNFKIDLPRLEAFLKLIAPYSARTAFEFRHESWLVEDVYACLRKHGCALCAADMEEEEAAPPLVATADFGYVRLRRDNYTPQQLKSWLKKLREQPWKTCHVFFKHDEVGMGAKFAEKFQALASE